MARRVGYTFNKQYKEINFVYDKYNDMYEAVAAAEGVDLTRYHAMEAQVAMTSKGSQAVKDYRLKEFERFGFTKIHFIRDEVE
ncbi:DUF2960 domain-containing protein [Shewanella algidipiscicola]|uniref:DUF2960 domain-containing protein n=1 Tax=Shewanella algidipiscicola TaxID=614070 RepID=A0ABQ4PDF1_9GAMM|nr:DUF2960 domain-containing protein [Shewanella algidipiscicola]GIU45585.1 hypothetical protein TUM4630_14010 [Shewanella algidipiscicola]